MSSNPFPIAPGYGNFPNGVFAPDFFAPEAQYYFRQVSIVEDITTSEYTGEITKMGDTVHIRKQPQVTVTPYTRGMTHTPQQIVDEETTLIIDKGNMFSFEIDLVVARQADVDYEELCGESAAYELKDAYDQDVLDFMFAGVDAGNVVGSAGSPETIGYGSSNDFRPLDAIARLNKILTIDNVPNTGRWLVAGPDFYEALSREVGKLVDISVTGDNVSLLRDKGVLDRMIHGFTMFETNNAPVDGSGNPILLAGHVSAVATAQQITETRVMEHPFKFAKIHEGLHTYGRKVLRPKALAAMHMSIADVA